MLSEQPGGLTRAEIVKAMGRGPSEVYRMLERLVARDYVSRSREGDRYALTMKLFVLGHRHPPVRRLVARALPLMDAFALDVRQSCHLVVADRHAAIVVAQASSPGNWEFGIRIGTQIDLLATSSGQTLLAFQDDDARDVMLALWDKTEAAATYAKLAPALAEYRGIGYRIGGSQQIRGVEDISVPVLTFGGHAIAVLTCPYIQRLDKAGADIRPDACRAERGRGETLDRSDAPGELAGRSTVRDGEAMLLRSGGGGRCAGTVVRRNGSVCAFRSAVSDCGAACFGDVPSPDCASLRFSQLAESSARKLRTVLSRTSNLHSSIDGSGAITRAGRSRSMAGIDD